MLPSIAQATAVQPQPVLAACPCLGGGGQHGQIRRGGVAIPNGRGRLGGVSPSPSPSLRANTRVRSNSLEESGSLGQLPGRVKVMT